MKATELLKTQHKEVDALFEKIKEAKPEEARGLVEQLATSLVAHSNIEKEIFYPSVRNALEDAKLHEAYDEHALVEFQLQKLLTTAPGDESFHARCDVLKEVVTHHVKEEEKEMFPQIEQRVGEEQLEQMGQQMEMRFEQIRQDDIHALLATAVQEAVAEAMPGTQRKGRAKATTRKPGATTRATRTTRGKAVTGTASRGAGGKRAAPKRGAAKGTGSARTASGRSTAKRGGAKETTGKSTTSRRSTAKSSTAKSTAGKRGGSRSTATESTGGKDTTSGRSTGKRGTTARATSTSTRRSTARGQTRTQGRSQRRTPTRRTGSAKGGRRPSSTAG
ncbi:hemerythrin domain-containing protein [Chondromyces apiculatus]|uniref:Hemerythrin HHE cation binding protein n=1 Tax=Chondromyces apiculatus DSM 436 TaxID=1192034 RepID=A0A017T2Z3_9BACT|nr:hemerythrin domain-containing protein [Chondromyces apiculatus]EYF03604.1 Hemerythrin HHE cation binding protein [Chondromyces apiculatus DSM 436]